jgi:hypothetical protein
MADASSISAKEMISSVIQNLISGDKSEGGYAIRTNQRFANEFPSKYDNKSSQDAFNLLVCAYPILFPFGHGPFSNGRKNNVSFINHVRWALRYYDRRFARHHSFPFVVFAIWQKLQALTSARIQINLRDFEQDAKYIATITKETLEEAIKNERERRPIRNIAILKLMKHIRAMNARIVGSDESRARYRARIYGTIITENPPNIWTTWNINDIDEPIVQILAGEDISLEKFDPNSGPDSVQRAKNVATNPKITTEVFYFIIECFLVHLFGIDARARDHITRVKGVIGEINAYFGTIEAQGRGTLHLHMLMWMSNSPTFYQMQEFLGQEHFRSKAKDFITKCIKAHLDPFTAEMIDNIPRESHLAYSRPPDPRCENFEEKFAEMEKRIVRNQQVHTCTENTCLCYDFKCHILACRRKAPWELSNETLIFENGEWKPKRLHPYLNNWNPALSVFGRMNHDIKWISNGKDTCNVAFYITKYSTKPSLKSHNITPLIARGFEYHQRWPSKRDEGIKYANKLLLFRCFRSITRDMEYSAPQVMSYLLGYGDHISSHNYVKLYWTSVEAAIDHAYPQLHRERYVLCA